MGGRGLIGGDKAEKKGRRRATDKGGGGPTGGQGGGSNRHRMSGFRKEYPFNVFVLLQASKQLMDLKVTPLVYKFLQASAQAHVLPVVNQLHPTIVIVIVIESMNIKMFT